MSSRNRFNCSHPNSFKVEGERVLIPAVPEHIKEKARATESGIKQKAPLDPEQSKERKNKKQKIEREKKKELKEEQQLMQNTFTK